MQIGRLKSIRGLAPSDGRVPAESGKFLATAERERGRGFYLTMALPFMGSLLCSGCLTLPTLLAPSPPLPLAVCLPSTWALGATLIPHPEQQALQHGPCHLLMDCVLSPYGKGPGQGHHASAVSHPLCVPGRSSRGGGDPTE